MYFLLFVHLTGIDTDRFLHKKHGTLEPIIKEYKNTKENVNIKTNIFVALFFAFAGYLIFDSTNPLVN